MDKQRFFPRRPVRTLFVILVGAAISGFGSRMAFLSGIGVAPIFMVDEGLCNLFQISLGTAVWIVSVSLLALGVLVDPNAIGFASVVVTLTSGFFLDLVSALIPDVPETYLFRFLYMLLGLVIYTFGVSVYLRLHLGGSCLEVIMLCISQKTGIPIGLARILSDSLWFILGLLMHGTWGLGTLASLLLCGSLIQFWTRLLESNKNSHAFRQ